MSRFKQLPQIQALMGNKARIRNIGIIAHIDHGKTTLADSLLAGTGLLSPHMAGVARVLDFLEEEQRRKITIKTANITLLYNADAESYNITLVDTPGHVDFTGRVTRALRVIDGAVVLVDAVEEVMAQTEIVIQQALQERVCPVLFINKVDRLITELKLNAQEIETKFNRIINRVNDLIELYSDPQFKDKWKIEAAKGTVVFGSALHRWGFTTAMVQKKGLKFIDIMQAHQENDLEKLRKLFPLHDAILNLAVQHTPNPLEAQKYRIEKIWSGDLSSTVGQAMVNCADNGPVVMYVNNVQMDPKGSAIAVGRLFCGTIKTGERVFLVDAAAEEVVSEVSVFMGAFREPVAWVSAGNLAGLAGLKKVKAGETIVDAACRDFVEFESIRNISDPVITIAIEPKNPADLPLLKNALGKITIEDPNLSAMVSEETGEYLLSGMGELHLEVAIKRLKEYLSDIDITTSPPRVFYRESMSKNGTVVTTLSPNRQNSFSVQAKPLDEKTMHQLEKQKKSAENILAYNDYNNILVDGTGTAKQLGEVLDAIISGFTFACRAGPLCSEPLRGLQIIVNKVQLSPQPELCSSIQIMHGVGKAIFASFLTGKPFLLEPVYRTTVSTPSELAGACTRILSTRDAKITSFEEKGVITVISCYISVAKTFGLSAELRSATSGRAFWQSTFDQWQKMPEKESVRVIDQLRERKGLPSKLPKPEQFLE